MADEPAYDAVVLVSFGGPERQEDVLPFLENVLRGKDVPEERKLEVAAHYELFGGVSPLNAENRALLAALAEELNRHGPRLPIYWGNRNWHPLLADTLEQMADDGIGRALAFVTSAFGSYSGCRQYLEDIERARAAVGSRAPQVDKLRLFYNHPGFVEAMADRTAAALDELAADDRRNAALVFTAHSLPMSMAAGCPYEEQLREACRLVAEAIGRSQWHLAFQSRSGPPAQPWLEPGPAALADDLRRAGYCHLVVVPIGFLSEHMEVVYDLDVELADACDQMGLGMVRADVVGSHPRLVTMIRELIVERMESSAGRPALGRLGPSPDACSQGCCPARTIIA